MQESRKQLVLKAIVEDYVATREPVGSKAVVERHNLGVSSATIRNDMAQLEDAGLIVQPHTSAGRIPTDAGYREFVDAISELKPLSRAERNAIQKILVGAVDLDDVLDRAVRLLAQITHQVAVVQYPSLRKVSLRRVELIHVTGRQLLVVIITDAGRVEQRRIELEQPISADDARAVSDTVNTHAAGLQLKDLEVAFTRADEEISDELKPVAKVVHSAVAEALQTETEERVVVAGTGNLTRYGPDFGDSLTPVLDMLEEQVILMRLLANQEDGVGVRIGSENTDEAFTDTSIVSTDYTGADQEAVARLGVIGPTRMDYPGAMSSVYAVARYLSDILGTN